MDVEAPENVELLVAKFIGPVVAIAFAAAIPVFIVPLLWLTAPTVLFKVYVAFAVE